MLRNGQLFIRETGPWIAASFGGSGTNESPVRQRRVSALVVVTTFRQLCTLCVGLDRLVFAQGKGPLFLGEGSWTSLALPRQL